MKIRLKQRQLSTPTSVCVLQQYAHFERLLGPDERQAESPGVLRQELQLDSLVGREAGPELPSKAFLKAKAKVG